MWEFVAMDDDAVWLGNDNTHATGSSYRGHYLFLLALIDGLTKFISNN